MEGKTALGASSPAKPALHMPEPLSTTNAATSSSHILMNLNLAGLFQIDAVLLQQELKKICIRLQSVARLFKVRKNENKRNSDPAKAESEKNTIFLIFFTTYLTFQVCTTNYILLTYRAMVKDAGSPRKLKHLPLSAALVGNF